MTVIITINFLTFIVLIGRANTKETLRLGMLFSQEESSDFSGLIPAIEIALETIEDDETLPFEFEYVYDNSMVSSYSL